jgi:hypothetical protein
VKEDGENGCHGPVWQFCDNAGEEYLGDVGNWEIIRKNKQKIIKKGNFKAIVISL